MKVKGEKGKTYWTFIPQVTRVEKLNLRNPCNLWYRERRNVSREMKGRGKQGLVRGVKKSKEYRRKGEGQE